MKYFNEENKYEKPTLIKFDKPETIKLKDLNNFLEQYKPFNTADVYAYERFEYGDFDNWVDAIYMSITIDAGYSKYFNEDKGIYKAGEYSFVLQSIFWNYSLNKPFWIDAPQIGFNNLSKGYKNLDEIEITLDGVFVISMHDKQKLESEYRF